MHISPKMFQCGFFQDGINWKLKNIPPVKVSVANSYSATVNPALLCAVMRTLYQVAGSKSSTKKFAPGFTLFEIWFHSTYSLKVNSNLVFAIFRLQKLHYIHLNALNLTSSYVRQRNGTFGNCHLSMWVNAM